MSVLVPLISHNHSSASTHSSSSSSSASQQRSWDGSSHRPAGLFRSIASTPTLQKVFFIFVGICIAATLQFTVFMQPMPSLPSSPLNPALQSPASATAAASCPSCPLPAPADCHDCHDEDVRHAVIATASGYSFNQLYPFVRSFRYACWSCQLIFFVTASTLTEDDRRHFRHWRVQLMFIDQLQPQYEGSSLVANEKNWAAHYRFQLYFDYLRALAGPSLNLTLQQAHRRNPITAELINQSRHEAYHTPTRFLDPYSRPSASPYSDLLPSLPLSSSLSHVFICDVRDLIFQQNIFNFLPYRHQFEHDDYLYQARHKESDSPPSNRTPTSDGVFVFTEERPLAEEGINQMWIRCAEPQIIQYAATRTLPVICSGTTLASLHAAILWLDALLTVMYAHINCVQQYRGFDQGAHIIAIYGSRIQAPVYLIPNARGPVATISMMNHPLHQTEYGQLLNERKEIYAVVHQYDRQIYHIKPQYERQFAMIGKDNLTWEY
jgi:hypothetical protein